MPLDPRLENYLASLDRALSPIPVSDRADIVTEIKSHVLSALDREPKPALDTVLAALGEPEIVANRYLLERGLKPGKPPISPVVKWIVIGFLGTFALGILLLALLLHAMGPAIRVSDKEDRVTLFGGFIDVDGKRGTVKIGDSFFEGEGDLQSFQGETTLPADKKVAVFFADGKVSLGTAPDSQLHWDCRGRLQGSAIPQMAEKDGRSTLDLAGISHLRCTLEFPEHADVKVHGNSGSLSIEAPRFNLAADLDLGKVGITPDSAAKYDYDLRVAVGKVNTPPSDAHPDYHLKVQVKTGKISVDDKE